MKKFLVLLALIYVGIAVARHNSSPSAPLSFKIENNSRVKVAADDAQCALAVTAPFEVHGYVIATDHPKDSPFKMFANACAVVWGDAAIQLATSDNPMDQSRFSGEALAVLKRNGCPSNYIKQHVLIVTLVGTTVPLHKAAQRIRESDTVTIRGYRARLESCVADGNPCVFDNTDFICVTGLSINGKSVGI
jgi:hypothetical protein